MKERIEGSRELNEQQASVVSDLLRLEVESLKAQINWLREYYAKHGDLYARDGSGRLIRKSNGQPVVLRSPGNDPRVANSIRTLVELENYARKKLNAMVNKANDPDPFATYRNADGLIDMNIFRRELLLPKIVTQTKTST